MTRSARIAALAVLMLAGAPLMAQEVTGAQPAATTQPKPAKPKLYDETANAKDQIAAAIAKAKKENRRVLIQWGGNWCSWCLKLDELCKSNTKLATKLKYEYDVVHIDAGRDDKNMDLARSLGATCEKDGFPFLTILDADGKPIANSATPPFENDTNDVKAGHNPDKLLEFFTKHQAPYQSASAILEEALARARKDNKRVFLHFGAPWCGWCHKMEDWMARPEIAAILAKDFIDTKIDNDRTIGGEEVMAKLTEGKPGGIPWFAFLDDAGKPLATSDGPDGNVGFPYQPAEIAHFVSMLKKTARNITAADIDTLEASLNATREADKKKTKPQ